MSPKNYLLIKRQREKNVYTVKARIHVRLLYVVEGWAVDLLKAFMMAEDISPVRSQQQHHYIVGS